MLPETRPGGYSSVVWGFRGTVISWADRSIGVPSCPSPPRPAVPLCAALSRIARGMSGFWIRQIPGYALHEKGLQKQISIGTLASSQKQRALLVSLINRWSTGRCVPPSVYIGFPLFVLPKNRPQQLSFIRQRVRRSEGRFSPGQTDPSARRSARPCSPASPPCAQPRPDPPVVCPGFSRTCLA